MLPGEPAPIRLMNTIWADTAGIHDDLCSADDMGQWLTTVGAAPGGGQPTGAELERARALRDAFRRLAAFCTGDQRPAAASAMATADEAIAVVNAAAADLPGGRLAIRDGSLGRAADPTISETTAALAGLANEAIDLLTGPAAMELRACQAPGCVLYFLKTHPRREWCSEACGNRARAARHYQRVKASRH